MKFLRLQRRSRPILNKVERFELYINTWEMCNAYSELNDPIDQRERFKAQDAAADAGDEEANHTDEDFLNALEDRYAADRWYRISVSTVL